MKRVVDFGGRWSTLGQVVDFEAGLTRHVNATRGLSVSVWSWYWGMPLSTVLRGLLEKHKNIMISPALIPLFLISGESSEPTFQTSFVHRSRPSLV